MQLPISNIFNVSVSEAALGVGEYNTSNIALFTREAFGPSFGNLGYNIYKSPTQVGIDFGTSSNTFAMATAIFAQQPNILANSGYLVIFPFIQGAQVAIETINFPAVPASGGFVLNYGVEATGMLNWSSTAADIEAALQALAGLAAVTVVGTPVSQNVIVTFTGVAGAATLLTLTSNTLEDVDSKPIMPTVVMTQIGYVTETVDAAIIRTQGLVQYFGVMSAELVPQAIMLSAGAIVQSLIKMMFVVSYTAADILPGGMLDLLRSGSFSQTRGLFYGDVLATALTYMAAYAGRGLSTNFDGSNTTQTQQLKTLNTIQPDPSMTQVLYAQAQAAGVDIYVSLQGDPSIISNGANRFFDQVYNLLWFVGDLQVSAFNLLKQTSTKIPQTESGMDSLKSTSIQVCQQAVTNQYLAPGTWTDPNTFGNPATFLLNISQQGFYVFSTPIAQQSAAARQARQAPLIQIAGKEAGAIHTGNILININP